MGSNPESSFPNLNSSNYDITSERDNRYNCIAWAAGKNADDSEWWWLLPEAGGVWPEGAPREETVKSFVDAFKTLEYQECHDGELECGYEKVALYAKDNVPTHMARQLANGNWTSKLGQDVDIRHVSLEALEGDKYGTICVYMKRRITT